MKFLLGTKEHMTQVFDEDGYAHGATAINAGPVTVTQVKTEDTDGYTAMQVGFKDRNQKNTNKAQQGHFKDLGNFKYVREYRLASDLSEEDMPNRGDTFSVEAFSVGDKVDVSGVAKGKGFQGTVKRYGFGGGPRTHGQKHSEREPGAVGATGPARVMKGTKMPGRMGGNTATVQNLEVLHLDQQEDMLYVKGSVPGADGSLVEITESVKVTA
jgi:large subunit ribosomal protein L3